ncbi:MAG: hypothetical protein E7509_07135 [Ruminococcus sp.]|nr:hypothetical protein [Ruminococcus sp.]
MHNKLKKLLVFALVLTMLMPLGSAFAAEESTEGDVDSSVSEDVIEEEEEIEEDDSMDIDIDTSVEDVKGNMSLIGTVGDYTIYTGIVKDKSKLEKALDKEKKEETYTPESYAVYKDAFDKATVIMNNPDATQYQIDEAYIALDRATEALVRNNAKPPKEKEEPDKIDTSNLQKDLEKLDSDLVAEDYTEYTWKLYQDTITYVTALIANPTSQADVDAARDELKYVKGQLLEAPGEMLAIIANKDGKEILMSTFEKGKEKDGKVISTSKKGFWVVETDVNFTSVSKFYMRLLSNLVEDAFVTVDLQTVYYMNPKSLKIEDEYAYTSEDSENGRLYKSSKGRMLFTTLDGRRLLADVELATENKNFKLYADEESHKIALYDIKADKYWWSTPVNPYGDSTVIDDIKGTSMKLPQRNQAASGLILEYGDLSQGKRNTSSLYSEVTFMNSSKGNEKWKINKNGVTVTYNYKEAGFVIPVKYILHEDRLEVTVDMGEVVEKDTNSVDGKIITALTVAPSFGAESRTDLAGEKTEGYIIVPDGSGAVIEYNNNKEGYPSYSQILFGRDKTTIPMMAPKVTEQAYLPVVATVSGKNGLVAIATDGESNASVNAQVSKQNKQAFNTVNFKFHLRSKDDFFMGGSDGTKITVFEKGKIKTEKISVSYYPISDVKEVNYADVAEVYRNYLIESEGLEKKTEANKSNFYVDLYGGVLKETSIFGIPVDLKTEITGFEDAQKIMQQLSDGGVNNLIINYNDWTNKSMVGKISTSFKPSGVLGGMSAYEDFAEAASKIEAKIFPSISNMEMDKSTWGFFTINSTAIRVSNAQSRQSKYSTAFGIQVSGKAPALLTPNAYSKAMNKMVESFTDKGVKNIGFGDYANTLVSDFSKRHALSREGTVASLVEEYKKANKTMENVIAEEPNAYILPYADYITNVPVYSSQYNVVDYDIPLYQMVIHGYVPFSSTPVNANSNAEEVFLLSLAAGAGIHYDMIYEEAYELLDTDYDDLYYANYNSWMTQAIEQYKVSEAILSQVSDKVITDYQINTKTGVIKTTYDDSIVITVDTKNATADVNGTVYDLSSATEGGLLK